MLRATREHVTSPELDQVERAWWDENAGTVARVWEMHDEISRTVRGEYLARARQFLLAGRDRATIIELGCGSGWVGQQIAGPALRILGTDFSRGQLDLARVNAERKGLSDHCRYQLTTADDWTGPLGTADGVIIHAFLHHLNGREITGVLDELAKGLRKGTRIWIYEPAFFSSRMADAPGGPGRLTSYAMRLVGWLLRVLNSVYQWFGLVDAEAERAFRSLTERAAANRWYLSPKEVPLDLERFTEDLAQRFTVRSHRWETVNLVGWVQGTNLLRSPVLRAIVNATVLPVFRWADGRVASEEAYLRGMMVAPMHAFHVWECEA